jgi:hypothetical protein
MSFAGGISRESKALVDARISQNECRKAVHEPGARVASGFHQVRVDLVRQQLLDTFGPGFAK